MIFRFLLLSEEANSFRREIQIDSSATFLDLHDVILDSCEYTHQEMTSFFICDENWRQLQEITRIPMDTDSDMEDYVMEDTLLEDLLEEEGSHLLFVFDYLSERSFFMSLIEVIPSKSLEAPIVSQKQGKAPKQTSGIEEAEARSMPAQANTHNVLSEENYLGEDFDDESYNEDEISSLNEMSEEDIL